MYKNKYVIFKNMLRNLSCSPYQCTCDFKKKTFAPMCLIRESREQVKSAEQLTTAKREKRGEIVAKLARSGWEIAPSRWPTFISCCATLTLLQVRCASVVKESLSRAGGIGGPRTHLLFGRNRHISFSGKKPDIIACHSAEPALMRIIWEDHLIHCEFWQNI